MRIVIDPGNRRVRLLSKGLYPVSCKLLNLFCHLGNPPSYSAGLGQGIIHRVIATGALICMVLGWLSKCMAAGHPAPGTA
jgi:hypothetical protein